MDIFTRAFWKGASERAVKTGFQTAAVLVGANAFDVTQFDYSTAGKLVAGAIVASLVTSAGNPNFVATKPTTPSAPQDSVDGVDPDEALAVDETDVEEPVTDPVA